MSGKEGPIEADILDRVRRTGDSRVSDNEARVLEARASGSMLARRLLGMHYYKSGDYEAALPHARTVFAADPSAETAKNLFWVLVQSGRQEAALAHSDAAAAHFDPIELADARCTVCHCLGRTDDAVRFGTEALALKDAATEYVDVPDPVVRPFDPRRAERNVISFSLFGRNQRYLDGAVRNAIVAPHLYPGWTTRFYVDQSVPEAVVDRLTSEGAQIRKTPRLDAARFGLFWRFLVEDDPDVDIYVVRDADSVLNIRERAAVEDWLASGRAFHGMRDHPVHCELILAGMFGAHAGNLRPMGERILSHVRAQAGRLNDRATDQLFLRNVVWPRIARHTLVHDAWLHHGDVRPFPPEFTLPWPMHVGQNVSG